MINSSRSDPVSLGQDVQKIVSDYIAVLITVINIALISQALSVVGVVTNSINIAVFVKQGFNESITVSLMGLAISDFLSLATFIYSNATYLPWIRNADVYYVMEELHYMTSAYPHFMFVKTTTCITTYITFERCLCVTLPLKVKSIITPKRACVIVILCFVFVCGGFVPPVYYCNRLGWKFVEERNKTLYGLIYTEDTEQIMTTVFAIYAFILPITCFVIVVTCTVFLVVKLKETSAWRQKSSSATMSSSSSSSSSRNDRRISKMVVIISTIFIISFVSVDFLSIPLFIEPEFSTHGRYKNLYDVVHSFGYIMESVNSTVNMFIYYNMSSAFRSTFDEIFLRKGKVKV